MTGKTRQTDTPELQENFDPEVGKARGVLRKPLLAGKLKHSRRAPSPELAAWIAHYWMISWDLRGAKPLRVENWPHPNVHLIFEQGNAVVAGVQTKKFSRILKGRSNVFGIKFRAGAFRPFLGDSVSKLANRMVPARRIFGRNLDALESILRSSAGERTKIIAADAFFRARLPRPDKTCEVATRLVEQILREPEIKNVEDLVRKGGISKRSLQRVFRDYVGASPKRVICRYRLHEIVECLNGEAEPNWAQLAVDLG